MASLVVQGLRLHSQCRKPGLDPWAGNKIPNATVEIEDPICCKSPYFFFFWLPHFIYIYIFFYIVVDFVIH